MNKNSIPIGRLLQDAGLISQEQLEKALQIQSEHDPMKLGEVFVLQEIIKSQTVDFFVERWDEIKEQGKKFPLGYYLQQAFLLTEQQIQDILEEQKISNIKFGDLAVSKGWLKPDTLDFFLDALFLRPPQLMSLIALEEYTRETLNLDRKYAETSLILSRILAWTGGNPTLSKNICHLFADSDLNIPAGFEVSAVDRSIEGSLIRNWQITKLGAYIRSLKENLLNNQKCNPASLLLEYQEILLLTSKQYQQTKEQKELLTLGLVALDRDKIQVTNIIYQQIFNPDWIVQELKKIKSKIDPFQKILLDVENFSQSNEPDLSAKTEQLKSPDLIAPSLQSEQLEQVDNISPDNTTDNDTDNNNVNNVEDPKVTEPITKFGSLLTLAGITLIVPLILAINNYYSSESNQQKKSEFTSEANRLKQFCKDLNLVDPASSLKLISQLEQSKQELLQSFPKNLEVFPDNCETALNKLRILAAPQLGKENRTIEAVKNLCEIPADSESINEAKVWIEHWYNSATWGEETKSYLSLVDDCPASDR
ncbi:MAG: hypothetical protein QNJ72_37980 [Pleurocapsa sp. MO_226.B13]|nr:hypothetical protein [Pleurocapsa sp. MO_226.B13]